MTGKGENDLNFYIQASNPKFQGEIELDDDSLSDAIESIAILNTENAILGWNYVSIPLSYKYDISYMIEDLLNLLLELQRKESGSMEIHWLPDTFRCNWSVSWRDGELEIDSYWECTVGHLEGILNTIPKLTISIRRFMNEWKEVLHVVIKGLACCGCDDTKIGGIRKLMEVYNGIEESGILYQE